MKLLTIIKEIVFHDQEREVNKFLRLRSKILRLKRKSPYYWFLRAKYWDLLFRNGASIELSTKLGENVTFPHGLQGIYLSGGAVIGDNCTILQQVTIGSNTLNGTKCAGAPIIGKDVYLGAGAKIIGGVKVGNNVRIGANAVVYKNVPDNCTVVSGGGMRIIPCSEERENSFVSYYDFIHGTKDDKSSE